MVLIAGWVNSHSIDRDRKALEVGFKFLAVAVLALLPAVGGCMNCLDSAVVALEQKVCVPLCLDEVGLKQRAPFQLTASAAVLRALTRLDRRRVNVFNRTCENRRGVPPRAGALAIGGF